MSDTQREKPVFDEPAGQEPAEPNPFSDEDRCEDPERRRDMERPLSDREKTGDQPRP